MRAAIYIYKAAAMFSRVAKALGLDISPSSD